MILAILQARVSSTRLPQKVLKTILGKPMIVMEIERIKKAKLIDKLILATSDDSSDAPLADLCKSLNVECYRGQLNDVLDRFYQAAQKYKPEYIVRLTGDCPLIDPVLVDEVIRFCLEGEYDYATNAVQPTYPDGLDVEIFRADVLEDAWKNATLPSQREHVTPYINSQPEKFKIGHLKNVLDLSHLRWTVDEPKDFDLVSKIYENLYPANPEFTTRDILNFLDANPELKTYNTEHNRNEGLKKSLKEDENVRKKTDY